MGILTSGLLCFQLSALRCPHSLHSWCSFPGMQFCQPEYVIPIGRGSSESQSQEEERLSGRLSLEGLEGGGKAVEMPEEGGKGPLGRNSSGSRLHLRHLMKTHPREAQDYQ